MKAASTQQEYHRPVTDEAIFKGAKEIVVKFIESGKLTPGNFVATFDDVYRGILKTVRSE
ncbi:MAG: hypothetical protein CSA32_00795 [Desulfobulbus propionicus]|nr:MAG: hypothetical protein CSA32_00795 [Desulfobulbus propionicus]